MDAHDTPDKARKTSAIAALLSEPTIVAAAEKVGINEKTLRIWLHQPKFSRAYRSARDAALRHALGRLQATAGKAVKALEKAIDGDDAKLSVTAAGTVLNNVLKAVEALDLAERVEALEQAESKRQEKQKR
jgi:hypothetical protein